MSHLSQGPAEAEVTKEEAYASRISMIVQDMDAILSPKPRDGQIYKQNLNAQETARLVEAKLELTDTIIKFVVARISEDPDNYTHYIKVLDWLKRAISQGITNREQKYNFHYDRGGHGEKLYLEVVERLAWNLSQKEAAKLEKTPEIGELKTQLEATKERVEAATIEGSRRYHY